MNPAHIARLTEEQEHAYQDTKAEIQQWNKFDNDYSALQDRLKTLPDKVTHSVMVPFGPLAFMPGQIIHSNEIMVLLGDNWFAERSAKQACQIVDRRKKHIHTMLSDLEEQKRLLGDRLGFSTEFKNLSENKDDIVEIKEEYDPEKEQLWREERKRKQAAARLKQEKTTRSNDNSTPTGNQGVGPTSQKEMQTPEGSLVKSHQKTSSLNVKTETKPGQSSAVESQDVDKTQEKRQMVEETLFARLDELERQEEELDELARLSDYEDDEDYGNQPMFSFIQENPKGEQLPKPKLQPVLSRTNSAEKRVQWIDMQQPVSSGSSTDEDTPRPATIHFTHTRVNHKQEATPSKSITSPADIYNQYLALQPSGDSQSLRTSTTHSTNPGLKSIMKTAHQSPSPETVIQKPAKQILPQLDSVFSGNIVERKEVTTATSTDDQPVSDKPAKRVSKFKAARQQQMR